MCGHFIHFPQPHFLILTDFFSWQLVYTFMYILQQHPLGLSSCTELSDFFLHSHQTLFVTREDALKTYLPSEHWILQNLKPLICLRFFFCIWVVVKICNTCHCFFHTWWRLHTWCDALRNLLVPITVLVVLFDGLSTRRRTSSTTSTTGYQHRENLLFSWPSNVVYLKCGLGSQKFHELAKIWRNSWIKRTLRW